MKIVDIWTLDNFSMSTRNVLKEMDRLNKLDDARVRKRAIRILWPELSNALDDLCIQEARKTVNRLIQSSSASEQEKSFVHERPEPDTERPTERPSKR